MPHAARHQRSRHHICAGVAHGQFDMRADRTQVERLTTELATDLQGPARYGADRRVQLRQPAALHRHGADQSGYGRYADARLAAKHRRAVAFGLSAIVAAPTTSLARVPLPWRRRAAHLLVCGPRSSETEPFPPRKAQRSQVRSSAAVACLHLRLARTIESSA